MMSLMPASRILGAKRLCSWPWDGKASQMACGLQATAASSVASSRQKLMNPMPRAPCTGSAGHRRRMNAGCCTWRSLLEGYAARVHVPTQRHVQTGDDLTKGLQSCRAAVSAADNVLRDTVSDKLFGNSVVFCDLCRRPPSTCEEAEAAGASHSSCQLRTCNSDGSKHELWGIQTPMVRIKMLEL